MLLKLYLCPRPFVVFGLGVWTSKLRFEHQASAHNRIVIRQLDSRLTPSFSMQQFF